MKTETSTQPAPASAGAVSSRFILTGLIAASATFALAASGAAQGSTTNPFGTFFHTVDGEFTNGVGVGEWSDVTPSAFISSPGGSAIPTTLGDPNANSLLYAGLGRTSAASDIALYLMYDFVPRTSPPLPGEVFATVTFPVTLPGRPTGDKTLISVLFQGAGPLADGTAAGAAGSFFDVFVDFDLNGTGDVLALNLGIIGATLPGPSPLSNIPHLRAELEVPLRIPAGFATQGGPLPGNGINPATGLYDPDPAFWGAAGAGNGGAAGDAGEVAAVGSLQSASAGVFAINPNGSVNVQPVPEPSSAALLLAGLAVFGARRRRA